MKDSSEPSRLIPATRTQIVTSKSDPGGHESNLTEVDSTSETIKLKKDVVLDRKSSTSETLKLKKDVVFVHLLSYQRSGSSFTGERSIVIKKITHAFNMYSFYLLVLYFQHLYIRRFTPFIIYIDFGTCNS